MNAPSPVPAWTAPPPDLRVPKEEVHVWRLPFGRLEARAPRWHLSEEEERRASAFRQEKDRRSFRLARGGLRDVLARYVGARPEDLVFSRTCLICGDRKHGKPRLAGPPDGKTMEFNLSHSGDLAVCAVSGDRTVGVDVERVGVPRDFDAIGRQFFSGPERAALAAAPVGRRETLFLEFWTRKESYLKARGSGLVLPADEWNPPSPTGPGPGGEVGSYAFYELPLGSDYVGTLAVQGAPCAVRAWDWTP